MRRNTRRISASIPILLLSIVVAVVLLAITPSFAFVTVDNENVAQLHRHQLQLQVKKRDYYDGHHHPLQLVQLYRRRRILQQQQRKWERRSWSPLPLLSSSSSSSSSDSSSSSTDTSSPPTTSFTSFTDLLLHYDTTTPIKVQGYVLTKRKFGKQLVFVDFHIDPTSIPKDLMRVTTTSDIDDESTTKYLCPAMLRQDFFQDGDSQDYYTGYKKCMLAGAKYEIIGMASPTRIPGNVVLLIKSLELLELPRQIQHIQSIINTAGKYKLIPKDEFLYACRHYLKSQGIDELNFEPPSDSDMTEHRWIKQLSKDICTNLPHDPQFPQTVIEQSFVSSKQSQQQQQRQRQQNGGNNNNNNKYNVPIAPPEYQAIPSELREALLLTTNSDIRRRESSSKKTTTTTTNNKHSTVNDIFQELQETTTKWSSKSGPSTSTISTTTAAFTKEDDDDGDDEDETKETMESSLSSSSLSSVSVTSEESTTTTTTTTATSSTTTSESVDVRYFAATTTSGWIQNRRRFDNNITTFSLVDNVTSLRLSPQETLKPGTESESSSGICSSASSSSKNQQRLNCILHPEYCVHAKDSSSPSKNVNNNPASVYRNLVSVGAKIAIEGYVVNSGGKPTLWIRHIQLLQCTSRSATIKHLLDVLHDGQISLEEASNSLLLESGKGNALLNLATPTQRQWKANELAVTLQESIKKQQHMDLLVDAANVDGGVKNPKLQILDKYRYINKLFPIMESSNRDDENTEAVGEGEETFSGKSPSAPQDQYRRGMMPNRSRNGLLGRRSSSSSTVTGGSNIRHRTSRYEHKKVPQMVWMEQQIRQVIQSHPEYKKRKLHILDIGGGKGNLANYLKQSFDNDEEDLVDIHVIDICEEAITNAQKKVEQQQQRSLQQLSSQASSSRATTTTTAVNYQLADASSLD